MTGVARNARIKSCESKFSPSGLNTPPAPSTSVTSNFFWTARRCLRTSARDMDFFSRRAASSGAMGARKCHGLISSNVSAPSSAAKIFRASSRPPEQTGLSAATRIFWTRKCAASSPVKTVLPAPVSVPVMKRIGFNAGHQSGNNRRAPPKQFAFAPGIIYPARLV